MLSKEAFNAKSSSWTCGGGAGGSRAAGRGGLRPPSSSCSSSSWGIDFLSFLDADLPAGTATSSSASHTEVDALAAASAGVAATSGNGCSARRITIHARCRSDLLQASTSGSALTKRAGKVEAAAADGFLFGFRAVPRVEADGSDFEDEGQDDQVQLREEVLKGVASVMPGLFAAHSGLLLGGPMVAPCCLPLPVMFSVANVSPDSWLANKRARAFHRSVVVCVFAQGAFALLRFARGDLIGGLYDGVMCGMGMYAAEAEGIRLMPSYVMMCGFNGLLGLLQVIQQMHGVPIFHLPLWVIMPPTVALLGAYCGWQFIKEVNAIANGLTGSGAPQDSVFVKIMGGDWWPSSLNTASTQPQEAGSPGAPPVPSRSFNPFAGDGHRLGSQ